MNENKFYLRSKVSMKSKLGTKKIYKKFPGGRAIFLGEQWGHFSRGNFQGVGAFSRGRFPKNRRNLNKILFIKKSYK